MDNNSYNITKTVSHSFSLSRSLSLPLACGWMHQLKNASKQDKRKEKNRNSVVQCNAGHWNETKSRINLKDFCINKFQFNKWMRVNKIHKKNPPPYSSLYSISICMCKSSSICYDSVSIPEYPWCLLQLYRI